MLGSDVDYGVRRVELPLRCLPVQRVSAPHATDEQLEARVYNGPLWLHGAHRNSEGPASPGRTDGPFLPSHWRGKGVSVFKLIPSAPEALRKVQLVVDNWMTGDCIGYKTLYSGRLDAILSQQGLAGARCGRTALLTAVHAGSEDTALMLARRGAVLRCEVTNENNPSEEISAVKVTVNAELRLQFEELSLPAPLSDSFLILPVYTDINNLDAIDTHKAEALRVAAYRGMGAVVQSLLQCRELLSNSVGICLRQPEIYMSGSSAWSTQTQVLFSELRGMLPPPTDRYGRTALHDVSRSVLPESSGFELEQGHLLAYAEALLAESGLHGTALLSTDAKGRLPLHYAAAFGHHMLLELMLSHNLEPSLSSLTSRTGPFTGLMGESHGDFKKLDSVEKVETWLVNLRDEDGWSPLGLAVSNGHLHCAKLLLDNGAESVPFPLKNDLKVPCAYLLALHRLGWEQMVRGEPTQDGYRFKDLGQDFSTVSDATNKANQVQPVSTTVLVLPLREIPAKRKAPATREEPEKREEAETEREEAEREEEAFHKAFHKAFHRAYTSFSRLFEGPEPDTHAKESLKVPESLLLAEALMAPLVESKSTHRFRRCYLVSRQLPSIIYYLVFLALLTVMAFTTAGVDGSLRFGSRRKGVSLPFILTSEVGGLVPKLFLKADEPKKIIQLLQGCIAKT